MSAHDDYLGFLRAKACLAVDCGFEVEDADINPILKGHQRAIVRWAVRGGRRAIFAAFGLGKSVIQLEILRLVLLHHAGTGRALIVAPLGVRQEFARDAAMLGLRICFVRWSHEVDGPGLYITNYESIRDGRLDPNLFDAISLDEASVLRSYGTKTFQTFLTICAQVPYRFVATATPSPNRYKELIHYSGFLGIMDTGLALTRFFQRNSERAGDLTLYPHMERAFWFWLNSWAVFLQRPSDLCRCLCHADMTSPDSGSANSQSSNGTRRSSEPVHGSADAIAATPMRQPLPIWSLGEPKAADAFAPVTGEKAPEPIQSGEASSTDALTRTQPGGSITADAGSQCVSGGSNFLNSSRTWETRHQEQQSNGETMTGPTAQITASGQAENNKPETPAATSKSHTKGKPNRSPHGLKNSESTTGNSTAVTSMVGRQSECSPTYCDDCRCDEGYELPELRVHWHELSIAPSRTVVENNGQARLFRDASIGLTAAAAEKRDSIPARIEKMLQILSRPENAGDHFLLWHDLESERHAIKAALPDAVSVFGTQDLDEREQAIIDFSDGRFQYLSTKPEIAGSGCNFQRHCHKMVFLGCGYKFNDFIQSVHRCHRFLQPHPVEVHIIHTEAEREIVKVLKQKWIQHEEMTRNMSTIIREHGLSNLSLKDALTRAIGVERIEARGERFLAANNDTVVETRSMESESVDLIVSSIPFGNHYEYCESYNDFGHSEDNAHFWQQMDFLTPELLRVLRPGRLACIHVKDRVLFGGVTGAGAPTVSPFHAECTFHYLKHGFDYMGMITVVTDVVRENNQTYRLGWSEQCKDGTKMGVGSPEYVLLFRRPQTDRTKGYADDPVTKSKTDYTRSRWQVDAHAFWRSAGDHLLTAEHLAQYDPGTLSKLFTEWSLQTVYDYETHVRIGEELEFRGALPSVFMALAPGSHHPAVWTDVNRMLTLNSTQAQKGRVLHVCPLQLDIVYRLINRYSNEGELVYDPFAGIMTVPYCALKIGRRGRGVELNTGYFFDGVQYLKAAEADVTAPSLFDALDAEERTKIEEAEREAVPA